MDKKGIGVEENHPYQKQDEYQQVSVDNNLKPSFIFQSKKFHGD